jgi:hypothetical protein
MSNGMHPGAPHHLPAFITAPGETDYFYNGSLIFLIIMVVVVGTLYFRLHALPEHLAHGQENKVQFQLVGVLALLALFTHNNGFWVAALFLALVPIPDLATPLTAIADALSRMARWGRPPGPAEQVGSDEVVSSKIVTGGHESATPSGSVGPLRAGAPPTDTAAHIGPVTHSVEAEPQTTPESGAGKRRQVRSTERA